MRRPPLPRFMMIAAVVAAIAGFLPVAAGTKEIVPASSPTVCARPNVDPATVSVPDPVMPDAAAKAGVHGDVVVQIDLDADSNVIGARVVKTPSPLLNNEALRLARAAKFRTAVKDCSSAPRSSYLFVVTFREARPFVVPNAMSDYFLGKWTCTSTGQPAVAAEFRPASDGSGLFLIMTTAGDRGTLRSVAQNYGARGDTIGVTEQNGARVFRAVSFGWKGNVLSFTGNTTDNESGAVAKQRMIYTRNGAASYARTIEDAAMDSGAPWTPVSNETCVKN